MIEGNIKNILALYTEIDNKIKVLELQKNDYKEALRKTTLTTPNQILNLDVGGCTLQNATRETIDKKEVKKLIGELEYKRVCKVTQYEVFKVYTTKENWDKYLNFGKEI